jgi:hypothetical protein
MKVLYTCDECGLENKSVAVRTREVYETAHDWLEDAVKVALDLDHHASSPGCYCETYTTVTLPFPTEETSEGNTIH